MGYMYGVSKYAMHPQLHAENDEGNDYESVRHTVTSKNWR